MKLYVLQSLGNDASISLHKDLRTAIARAESRVDNVSFYEWKHDEQSDCWMLNAKDRHETAFVIEHLEVEP